MRIIMFAGKGGVGKTSIASATGIKAAGMGHKTLIMSLDIAHSLSDIFCLDKGLMDKNKGMPHRIDDRLWIQELDIGLLSSIVKHPPTRKAMRILSQTISLRTVSPFLAAIERAAAVLLDK